MKSDDEQQIKRVFQRPKIKKKLKDIARKIEELNTNPVSLLDWKIMRPLKKYLIHQIYWSINRGNL